MSAVPRTGQGGDKQSLFPKQNAKAAPRQKSPAAIPAVEQFPEVDLGMGLTARICAIGPELAQDWLLLLGEKQRTVKKAHLDSLIDDMRSSRFVFNAQPIIFDSEGMLNDGQHRLRAIVETDTTQTCLVVWGLDPDAFASLDNISKRTGGDVLGMMGMKNQCAAAAAAALLWKYETGQLFSNAKLSPSGTVEVLARFPQLPESVTAAWKASKVCGGLGIPAFCHYIFADKSRPDADMFFKRLADDANQVDGNPILALRRRLQQPVGKNEKIHLIFKAWNLFRQKKRSGRLIVGPNEPFPDPL